MIHGNAHTDRRQLARVELGVRVLYCLLAENIGFFTMIDYLTGLVHPALPGKPLARYLQELGQGEQ